jgi:beta-fructofuranosidase
MVLALADKWIWDSWYFRDGDVWHAWFLQADRSLGDPDLRHWNVTQGHATSRDLRDWEHHGTSFAPSAEPAWDDCTTWTGSVIRDAAGTWHLFYTGTARAEDGLRQRIGHATAPDGHHWSRVGDGLALDLSGDAYEEYAPGRWHDRAMRDPWVMPDPEGGWMMFFTARVPGMVEPNAAGAIGFATSPDLATWTLQRPVFSGGFGQLEVPQVFERAGRWYCLFCTDAGHWSEAQAAAYPGEPVTGTHYLIAQDPRGPWRIAAGRFLDGSWPGARYAGRILDTTDGLVLMAFRHTAENGSFIGEIGDPIPVAVDADGLLHLAPRTQGRS